MAVSTVHMQVAPRSLLETGVFIQWRDQWIHFGKIAREDAGRNKSLELLVLKAF